MSDFRDRIERALAEHDAMVARCPVNNPKRGLVFRPFDTCPQCKAKASESCGLSSGAGYRLACAVRDALAAPVGRNAKRHDRSCGHGPKDEHAVPAEERAGAQGDAA